MEQKQTDTLASSVVEELHKDFVIVGKHRVHSWYAWAIVGIMVGMFLGIVYVANRSAQFIMSEASNRYRVKPAMTVVGAGGIDYFIPVVMSEKNPRVWLGGDIVRYNPIISSSVLNRPVRTAHGITISNPSGPTLLKYTTSYTNAIGIKGKKMYYGTIAGDTITIDTTKPPTADLNTMVTYTFKGRFVRGDGRKFDVPLTGTTVMCGSNLSSGIGTSLCTDYSRQFTLDASGALRFHDGTPVFVTTFSVTPPNGKTEKTNKSVVFPAGGGNFTIVFRRNDLGNMYVSKIVAGSNEDTGTPVDTDDSDNTSVPALTPTGNATGTTSTPALLPTNNATGSTSTPR